MSTRLAWPVLVLVLAAGLQSAPRKEANVVYGMYSGLALLMDVYQPEKPNGYGVVLISGSGWHAPQEYGAPALKDAPQLARYRERLTAAGYTVFAINHRAAPRFRYPAAVEDAQRAVRYVRHHAARYGIDPSRLGAVGGSSGGHLVSMLGVLDGRGDAETPDPVNRQSAKVQCVVARAAPADQNKLVKMGLLEKLPDHNDQRRVRVRVTPDGHRLLERLAPAQRQANDVLFECLTADQFTELRLLIPKLVRGGDRALRLLDYLSEQSHD